MSELLTDKGKMAVEEGSKEDRVGREERRGAGRRDYEVNKKQSESVVKPKKGRWGFVVFVKHAGARRQRPTQPQD